MKKLNYHILFLSMLPAIILLTGCGVGDGETTLSVSFSPQPQGGTDVNVVETTVNIRRNFNDNSNIFQSSPDPDDILVTFEWWWESGDGRNTERMTRNTRTIRSSSESYNARITAGTGYVFMNYYYLRVIWTDDRGQREARSRKVFFSSSNKMDEFLYEQEVEINMVFE